MPAQRGHEFGRGGGGRDGAEMAASGLSPGAAILAGKVPYLYFVKETAGRHVWL